MKARFLKRLVALGLLAGSSAALACADSGCYPSWKLFAGGTGCEDRGFLAPGNDTRVNLLFLLRDRAGPSSSAGLSYPKGGYDAEGYGTVFLDPYMQRAAFYPDPAGENAEPAPYSGYRCAGYEAGTQALAAAMQANRALPAAEAAALLAARKQAVSICKDGTSWERERQDGASRAPLAGFGQWPAVISAAGREFLAYLQASDAFYGERWPDALSGYRGLGKAGDPWVREAASYMHGRALLAAAQQVAFEEYGFYDNKKVDQQLVRAGREALAAYLKGWPKGRYAQSAQGLQRRGMWLAGDYAALTGEYERLLDGVAVERPEAGELVQEIDNKLLFNPQAGKIAPRNLLLLATQDLMAMRTEIDESNGEVFQQPTIKAGDLAAQAALFAGHDELYSFLQANYAFYIDHDYARVLQLIPDAARQPGFTNLAFSRQVLRGQALAARGDRNEAGFWQELMGGAKGLWQRPTAELGLAMNWERHGKLAQVFAKDSPISEPMIRRELLIHSAGQPILRGVAADLSRPQHERDLATFILLYKDLSRGRFGDFVQDRALVRPGANTDGGLWNISTQEEIPLGLFSRGKWSDGYSCPAIDQTARALAANPQAIGPRLCLGDFWRLNGFDGF